MTYSLQIEPVVSLGTMLIILAGVAALSKEAMNVALSDYAYQKEEEDNPIPWEEKQRLYKEYGKWAVELAEACCPRDDVACVEREAKRLYQARRR
jgi:hypothetical protein